MLRTSLKLVYLKFFWARAVGARASHIAEF